MIKHDAKVVTNLHRELKKIELKRNVNILNARIASIFKYHANNGTLEQLKHTIAIDDTDGLDLEDLVFNAVSRDTRQYLLWIFSSTPAVAVPTYKQRRFVVMSDLDNTVMENSIVGKVHYKDKCVVPGVSCLIRAFISNDESYNTTPIFVSARPKLIEFLSRKKLKENVLAEGGIVSFAFSSGSLEGPLLIASGLKDMGNRKMASKKHDTFSRMRMLFPHDILIFFGDNTQGDAIAAESYSAADPDFFAYIRTFSTSPPPVTKGRIMYHRGYYEAISRTPWQDVKEKAIYYARAEAVTRNIESRFRNDEFNDLTSSQYTYFRQLINPPLLSQDHCRV